MTIETKFNIGDEVWYMENNKVCCDTISAIHLHVYEYDRIFNYSFGLTDCTKPYIQVDESKLFRTKQELLDSL